MGFYIIVLSAAYSTIFSFAMMIMVKQRPPEKWGDRAYSKSRFALWTSKRRMLSKLFGPIKIDIFRLVGTIISLILFIICCIALIIDTASNQIIYVFLGRLLTIIISLFILLVPLLYEAFLIIWWSIVNKNSPNNSRIKKLRRIKKKVKNNKN